jgi:predicted AAA+ superfamily ATPase
LYNFLELELAYVNLEYPELRLFVSEDHQAFIAEYKNGAILDEIQNTLELLSFMQVLVDQKNQNSQFILTGSHQLALHEAISQSLAGRTALLSLLPLSIGWLKDNNIELDADKHMLQGGYPRIYQQNLDSTRIYADYYQTHIGSVEKCEKPKTLENRSEQKQDLSNNGKSENSNNQHAHIQRDVRQMINIKDLNLFSKFIKVCAGRIGSLLEAKSKIHCSKTLSARWICRLRRYMASCPRYPNCCD